MSGVIGAEKSVKLDIKNTIDQMFDKHDDNDTRLQLELMVKSKVRRNAVPKVDAVKWNRQAKQTVKLLSYMYIFMGRKLSAEEAKAIQRFCDENGAVPQLSTFPVIRFLMKETNEIVEKPLSHLISMHNRSKEEEQKTKAMDKKREEREAKWKPTTGRYSS